MALGCLMIGGQSSRMRRAKALLPWYPAANDATGRGSTLALHLGTLLQQVCGNAVLVGNLEIPEAPFPRIEDAIPGMGPLGGLLSALRTPTPPAKIHDASHPAADPPGSGWRLVLSCDSPFVTEAWLRRLLELAETSPGIDAVVSQAADGQLHPLCAVYHCRITTALQQLLETAPIDRGAPATGGRRHGEPAGRPAPGRAPSMHRFLQTMRYHSAQPADAQILCNVNTMQDYLAALRGVSSLLPAGDVHPHSTPFGKAPRDAPQ